MNENIVADDEVLWGTRQKAKVLNVCLFVANTQTDLEQGLF
jgi:hypothetical protein